MLDHEIAEFGRRMGMPGLAFPPSGVVALDVEGLGRLHIERRNDAGEVLVYVTRPLPAYDRDAPRRVLALCDYRLGLPVVLTGGVHNDTLMLLVRMPEREFTAGALEAHVRVLGDLVRRAAGDS